jgi:hypothetical protein
MKVRVLRRLAVVVLLGLLALPSSAAALTNFTWSGGAGSDHTLWSTGRNWVGGSAPSGAVGTLRFPALSACSHALCQSFDDVGASTTVNAISIDNIGHYAIVAPDEAGITLGAGGITAASSGDPRLGSAGLFAPLTLSAPQTWSIGGSRLTLGPVKGAQAVSMIFKGHKLSVGRFGSIIVPAKLDLATDTEIGPVSAKGDGLITLAGERSSLNTTDGNAVRLSDRAKLHAPFAGNSSGPLTLAGGVVQVGNGRVPEGILAVHGDFAMDSKSFLQMVIDRKGTKAGADYSQLTTSGDMSLGRAHLQVLFPDLTRCPTLHAGDVDTLVKTTGSVKGHFSGLRNGTAFRPFCQGKRPRLRIHYAPHAVTLTVLKR